MALTKVQKLVAKHGTLVEFSAACHRAADAGLVTYDEAEFAIKGYANELREARKASR